MTLDVSWLRELAHHAPLGLVFLSFFLAFIAMYVGFAGGTLLVTRRILPRLSIGEVIDRRPLLPGQVRTEVLRSLVSIAVFASYGVATVAAERSGLVVIRWQETALSFLGDLLLLFLWNEVHFYLIHRLLHTRWLMRHVHTVHHRSVVPTPFSTYSFHWVEAVLLSSVMLLWLMVLPLGIGAVLCFPLLSLALNCIGHMNYAVFPGARLIDLMAGCRRHTWHHTHGGNYGFYLPWLDALFGTRQR